jgi:hypothetical protein
LPDLRNFFFLAMPLPVWFRKRACSCRSLSLCLNLLADLNNTCQEEKCVQCGKLDLRHSFASVGAMSGLGLGVVGGHASAATTARYSHFADDPVRRASERIAADIAASLEGGAAGNVIGLKR